MGPVAPYNLPKVETAPGLAHSGSRVLGGFTRCSGGEISACVVDLWVRFTVSPQLRVRFFAGLISKEAGPLDPIPLRVDLYDINGRALPDSVPVTIPPSLGVGTQVDARYYSLCESPCPLEPGDAAYLHLYGFTRSGYPSFDVAIDDLSFWAPDSPSPIAIGLFGISRTDNPLYDEVAVPVGGSAKLGIHITRIGPVGDLDFSLENPPQGISASFSPNPAGGDSVSATLSTSAAAQGAERLPVTVLARRHTLLPGQQTESRLTIPVTIVQHFGLEIDDADISQATQFTHSITIFGAGLTNNPALFSHYDGVPLVAGKRTVVRVYGTAIGAPDSGVPGVRGYLYGFDPVSGNSLPGSPLISEEGPKTLLSKYTLPSDRLDPAGAFTFTLPESWTHGEIRLRAELAGADAAPNILAVEPFVLCTETLCQQRRKLVISGVAFTPTRTVVIDPLNLGYRRSSSSPATVPQSPQNVFGIASALTPGQLIFRDYVASIDISDIAQLPQKLVCVAGATNCQDAQCTVGNPNCQDVNADGGDVKNGLVADRVKGWVMGNLCSLFGLPDVCAGLPDYNGEAPDPNLQADITVGVNAPGGGTSPARGATNTLFGYPYAVADQNRPLTSVAHELFHALGARFTLTDTILPHAGTEQNCPGGGGESWPPDDKGYLQGVGIDTRPGSGATLGGPYRLIGVGVPGAPAEAYDLMSYCLKVIGEPFESSGVPDSWVSPRNWMRLLGWFATGAAGATAAQARAASAGARLAGRIRPAAGPTLLVTGFATASGAAYIGRVQPGTGKTLTGPTSSAYHLVLRNAAGKVISDVPMLADVMHVDHSGPLISLTAQASAPGVASAAITRAGVVLATRVRSAHAPVVRIISPRRGSHLGGRGTVTLRWRATDADHDPLVATVNYSRDGGRRFKTIFIGPSSGTVKLPARLLPTARRALLSVSVSDGFNLTTVRSGPFVSRGAPPSVVIVSPQPGQRVRNDAALYLEGVAVDEDGHLLGGRALRWYADGRRLGTGSSISPAGLPAGVLRIVLVARDRRGRTARATVRLLALGASPAFVVLSPRPAHLRRFTRRLTLLVASTVPAELLIAGHRFTVDRRVRRIRVRLHHAVRQGSSVGIELRAGRQVLRTRLLL